MSMPAPSDGAPLPGVCTTETDDRLDPYAIRMRGLIEASQVLASIEDLQELLQRLLEIAQDVTQTEASSILLYTPSTDKLHFAMALNEKRDVVQEILTNHIELRIGEGIAGHVAQHKTSLIVNDAYADERFSQSVDKTSGFITHNLMCVPVLYQDELLGVVQVLNAKSRANFARQDLVLLESFASLAAVALIRARLLRAMLAQQRMHVQLEAASAIQDNFLPELPDMGPDAGIWAATKPAIFVGGDLYDCIGMADGSFILCVADVSGKGLPAALVGAALLSQIRSRASLAEDLKALLEGLNGASPSFMGPTMFATIVLGRYYPKTGRLSLAMAGHPAPIIVRPGDVEYLHFKGGPPLGVDRAALFSQHEVQIAPGESAIFYSDGVLEARSKEREFFGETRVTEALRAAKTAPRGEPLLQTVTTWFGEAPANDDITILEVWMA